MMFYPKFIREILTHIPTLCFETIDWNDFLNSSSIIIKNYLKGKPNPVLMEELRPQLGAHHLQFDSTLKGNYTNFNTGESVLKLYFLQLKCSNGLFLDLRANHFHQLTDGTSLWNPNALFHQFKDDFRLSLIELYKAFYYKNDANFEQSLIKLKMTEGLSAKDISDLKELFLKHFGVASEVKFELANFQESFLKIFEFFMGHKIKLQSDFVYLGFYLTTLYMHLEKYPESFDVEKIFLEVFPK